MEYTTEVLDRSNGELVIVSLGDWITVSELAERHSVGPRQLRAILHHIGILQQEGGRFRLTPQAVKKGFGKRIEPSKAGQFPFDVLSPLGQSVIADIWDDALADIEQEKLSDPQIVGAGNALDSFKLTRSAEMTTQQQVCWLLDHFPGLNNQQVATLVDAAPSLVSRYVQLRSAQRSFAFRLKTRMEPSTQEHEIVWPGASSSEPPMQYADREELPDDRAAKGSTLA